MAVDLKHMKQLIDRNTVAIVGDALSGTEGTGGTEGWPNGCLGGRLVFGSVFMILVGANRTKKRWKTHTSSIFIITYL
jgi:hypothetical protein